MKRVKEYLYEKFVEDSDPIHDLGIGIFIERTFNDMSKIYEFLYDIIPALFKVNHPMDILAQKYPELVFKANYGVNLRNYCKKYISYKGDEFWWALNIIEFKNYLVNRAMGEGIIHEGVADKYAERAFHIYEPDSLEGKKIETAKKIKQPIREPIIEKNQIIHRFNDIAYIVKNPTTLKNIQDVAKGVVSKKGDLYLINFNFYTHTEIINALVKLGEIKDQPKWWHSIPENFITIQRVAGKNAFMLGESNEVLSPIYNKGDYAVRLNMPGIEKARKHYIPFIKAAQKKNPQYKFIPKLIDELNESDQTKSLQQKTQHITDGKYLGLQKKIVTIFNDAGKKPVKICLVNGSYVKGTKPGLGFKEFVEGGQHYADSYPGYKKHIPEDEIWVDDVLKSKPGEVKATMQHEFIERNLMKYKKWSYSKAHEYSNKKEAELRKK